MMLEPEFNISIENDLRYGRIICAGKFNEKVFLHLVDRIKKDKAESLPGKTYLVDIRATDYVLDTFARYRLAEYGALALGSSRIAVLGNLGQTDKMTENTAFNRGLIVLITHIPADAEAWVTGKSKAPSP